MAAIAVAATPTPAAAPAISLAVLRKVGLRPTDLPSGYAGNSVAQGVVTTGQVTLDMCGVTFASEALRIARHQVGYAPTSKLRLPVSNEVVAYSGSGAALALAELRHAAAHCPKGVVASAVAGMPPTLQRVTLLRPSTLLPASSIRFAITATDPKTGQVLDAESSIYTVRGQVLSGMYVSGSGAPAAALALHLQRIVLSRLAQLVPATT